MKTTFILAFIIFNTTAHAQLTPECRTRLRDEVRRVEAVTLIERATDRGDVDTLLLEFRQRIVDPVTVHRYLPSNDAQRAYAGLSDVVNATTFDERAFHQAMRATQMAIHVDLQAYHPYIDLIYQCGSGWSVQRSRTATIRDFECVSTTGERDRFGDHTLRRVSRQFAYTITQRDGSRWMYPAYRICIEYPNQRVEGVCATHHPIQNTTQHSIEFHNTAEFEVSGCPRSTFWSIVR